MLLAVGASHSPTPASPPPQAVVAGTGPVVTSPDASTHESQKKSPNRSRNLHHQYVFFLSIGAAALMYHFQVPLAGAAVTPEDEAAAMAAMFQAQTANWEEAQEKMSQLVSRTCAVPCLRSSLYLMNFVPLRPAIFRSTWYHTVRPVFTVTRVAVLLGAESLSSQLTITPIDLCLRVMFATGVDRKVSSVSFGRVSSS